MRDVAQTLQVIQQNILPCNDPQYHLDPHSFKIIPFPGKWGFDTYEAVISFQNRIKLLLSIPEIQQLKDFYTSNRITMEPYQGDVILRFRDIMWTCESEMLGGHRTWMKDFFDFIYFMWELKPGDTLIRVDPPIYRIEVKSIGTHLSLPIIECSDGNGYNLHQILKMS